MKMNVPVFVAVLLFYKDYAAAQTPQELVVSATYTPPSPIATSRVKFDLVFYPNDNTVEAAQIVNPSTGTLSDSACQFTTASSTLTAGTDGNSSPTRTMTVYIDGATDQFQNSAGTSIPCDYKETSPGQYTFNIRGLATAASTTSGNDREYTVVVSGANVVNAIISGSTTFSGPPPNTLTVLTSDTYTTSLTVVDAATQTDQTALALGTPFQLKFTFTASNYEANMALAGATVDSCLVTDGTTNVGMIRIGCVKSNTMFKNMNTNSGFARDSSSGVSGTTKTYIAFSPVFEMAGFELNPVTDPNALTFECVVTYCLSDSDTTTDGQCGAKHCSTGRKKREATSPDATVSASVNITSGADQEKSCKKCSDSPTFQATVAGLMTFGAILLGCVILLYANTRHAFNKVLEKARASCSSCSSVTGSEYVSSVFIPSTDGKA